MELLPIPLIASVASLRTHRKKIGMLPLQRFWGPRDIIA
jgi:hypothetical protein